MLYNSIFITTNKKEIIMQLALLKDIAETINLEHVVDADVNRLLSLIILTIAQDIAHLSGSTVIVEHVLKSYDILYTEEA